jgi:uncharacterized protein YbjT (DUF2867 family)
MELKVIITGATGMVGEGVLLECIEHQDIKEVLIVNRRPSGLRHPKLKECIIPDFLNLEGFNDQLKGYDACFYCAGVSSVGMKEADYRFVTYDITMHFAQKLASLNHKMVFVYVSGSMTDSTEKGNVMWARVKGRTENALMQLPFKRVYNFRPGFMKPTPGQRNIKSYYKYIGALYPILHKLFPNHVSTLSDVGLAMINCIRKGYPKQILEVKDLNFLGKE